jgi:hypothetical protein
MRALQQTTVGELKIAYGESLMAHDRIRRDAPFKTRDWTTTDNGLREGRIGPQRLTRRLHYDTFAILVT